MKNDTAFEFDVQVPADAGIAAPPKRETTDRAGAGAGGEGGRQTEIDDGTRSSAPARRPPRRSAAARRANRTLHFEYDLATARVTLLEDYTDEPRPPRWASMSPDGKTIVFARNHNLFMMDADNYAKALKKADDPTIVETQLTTDGEEHYSYGRSRARSSNQREQEQQQQQQQREDDDGEQQQQDDERDIDRPERAHAGRSPSSGRATRTSSRSCAAIRAR